MYRAKNFPRQFHILHKSCSNKYENGMGNPPFCVCLRGKLACMAVASDDAKVRLLWSIHENLSQSRHIPPGKFVVALPNHLKGLYCLSLTLPVPHLNKILIFFNRPTDVLNRAIFSKFEISFI